MKRLLGLGVPALIVVLVLLAAHAAAGPRTTLVGTPTIKILVNKDGWYRVPAATLATAGFVSPSDLNKLHLRMNGQDVPFQFHNGVLEFYGQAVNTVDTDTRAYYFSTELTDGLQMSLRRARATAGTPSGTYPATLNAADRDFYLGGLLVHSNPGAVVGNGWFGAGILPNCCPYTKTLDAGKADVTQAGSLLLYLYGLTNTTHTIQVKLNGTNIGAPMSWFGIGSTSATLTVPANTLVQGNNTVGFTDTSPPGDFVDTDTYALTYRHLFVADSDKLDFQPPATPFSVSGFTNSNIRLLDLSDPLNPRELFPTISGSGSAWTISVTPPAGATRLYAFTDAQTLAPKQVVQDVPSTLKSPSNQADLIIIAYKDATTDLVNAVQPLATRRVSEGLAVKVVNVEDVWDEFGNPIGSKSPAAIKSFLDYARQNWTGLIGARPKYVLLVGDATSDPREYTVHPNNRDLIPTNFVDATFSEAPSDDSMTDFDGNGKPELAVGRLPVNTVAEANTVIQKILDYGVTAVRPKTALLVADNFDRADYCFGDAAPHNPPNTATSECPMPGFSKDLEATSLTPAPYNVAVTEVFRPDGCTAGGVCATDTTTHNTIMTQASIGPVLVNWFGHGSFQAWNGKSRVNPMGGQPLGLLVNADAPLLTNTGKLSLYLMMTCQNAYFAGADFSSIGEALLLATNGGQGVGAVAVWGSSGDTIPFDQVAAAKVATSQLFGATPARLGDAMLAAKNSISDPDVLHTWTLLGDPTMKLRI